MTDTASMPRRPEWKTWWPVLAVAVVGFLITLLVFRFQQELERERVVSLQIQDGTAKNEAIRDRFKLVEERLIAVRSLFSALPTASQEQFQAFVQPLLETRVAVETIQWLPRVTHDQRSAFEAATGFPIVERGDAKLQAASERSEYFPVRYFEPYAAKAPEMGRDYASENRWHVAMTQATDSGQPVVIDLLPPKSSSQALGPGSSGMLAHAPETSLLVVIPVYAAAAPMETMEERRAALQGFVAGLVRLEALVRLALATQLENLDIRVRPTSAEPGAAKLSLQSGRTVADPLDALHQHPGAHRLLNVFAGREYEMVVAPKAQTASAGPSQQAWMVLVFGALTTLASCGVAVLLSAGNRRVINLVAERTHELRASRQSLEEAKERLSLALASAKMWAWDFDIANKTRIWLDNPEPMFGPKPETGWPPLNQMIVAEDYPGFLAASRASVKEGVPYHCEFRLRRTDGVLAWLEASGVVLKDAQGRLVRMIGVTWDITAHKQHEEALSLARDAADAASRAKTSFLGTMSHEIRTPMNGVLGMADLLTLTDLTEEQQGYVRAIQESSNGLLGILNAILDYTRLESGHLDLEISTFAPCALAMDIQNRMLPIAKQRGLELSLMVAPTFPAQMLGDSKRIGQVLLQLVDNAIKFSDAGRIDIRLIEATGPSGGLRIEVADMGIGIPAESFEKVFQPFSQVDGSITRRHGGTGLGLALCKRLVEGMKGQIGVESVVGGGTTFWFELLLPVVSGPATPPGDPVPGVDEIDGVDALAIKGPVTPIPPVAVLFDPSVLNSVVKSAGIEPQDLLDLFFSDTEASLARLVDAVSKVEQPTIHRLAHSIKSSAAGVGGMRLSAVAWQMEKLTQSHQAGDPMGLDTGQVVQVQSLFASLMSEFEAFRQATQTTRTSQSV